MGDLSGEQKAIALLQFPSSPVRPGNSPGLPPELLIQAGCPLVADIDQKLCLSEAVPGQFGTQQPQHTASQALPPSMWADAHILNLGRAGGGGRAVARRRGYGESHDLARFGESNNKHSAWPVKNTGDDGAGDFQGRHVRITVTGGGCFRPYLRCAVDVTAVTSQQRRHGGDDSRQNRVMTPGSASSDRGPGSLMSQACWAG